MALLEDIMRMKIISVGLVFALCIFIPQFFEEVESASPIDQDLNNSKSGITYLNSTWTVPSLGSNDQPQIFRNQTVVMRGNIVINSGCGLILDNVTLIFNSTSRDADGTGFGLVLNDGGSLKIIGSNNRSRIEANDPQYRYFFKVFSSKFVIRDTDVTDCGSYNNLGESVSREKTGLFINAGGTTVENCTFEDCYIGLKYWEDYKHEPVLDGLEIKNVTINNTRSFCIDILGVKNGIITNISLSNGTMVGLAIQRSFSMNCSYVYVQDIGYYYARTGILSRNNAHNDFSHPVIFSNCVLSLPVGGSSASTDMRLEYTTTEFWGCAFNYNEVDTTGIDSQISIYKKFKIVILSEDLSPISGAQYISNYTLNLESGDLLKTSAFGGTDPATDGNGSSKETWVKWAYKGSGWGHYRQVKITHNVTAAGYDLFNAVRTITINNGTDSTVHTIWANDHSPIVRKDLSDKTATTGDNFIFKADIVDEAAGVRNASVEFWFGEGTHTNMTMTLSDHYANNTRINSKERGPLFYRFHASDNTGKWTLEKLMNITVLDNDDPLIGPYNNPSIGYTGDEITLSANITDNWGIESAQLKIWSDDGFNRTLNLTNAENIYSANMTLPSDSLSDIKYEILSNDTSGNYETLRGSITMLDNDAPVFLNDTTCSYGTTGDDFTFSVDVVDNLFVKYVAVEYWYGGVDHLNLTMVENGDYQIVIPLPKKYIGPAYYIFHSTDNFNNWATSMNRSFSIQDNDAPVLYSDISEDTTTTGDEFTFVAQFTDNIGISNVSVEYWQGEGEISNITMTHDGSDQFSLTILVNGSSLESINYTFHVVDDQGNYLRCPIKTIQIIDNDRPKVIQDLTDDIPTTGDPFNFSFVLSDNIIVEDAELEMRYGGGDIQYFHLTPLDNSVWQATIIIEETLEQIEYRVICIDPSLNQNLSSWNTLDIIDNDMPSIIEDRSELNITTGDRIHFSLEVLDNIGISSVVLHYRYNMQKYEMILMIDTEDDVWSTSLETQNIEGYFTYYFVVNDTSLNQCSGNLTNRTIVDNDRPIIISDGSGSEGTTGESFDLSFEIFDNIEILSTRISYRFNEFPLEDIELEYQGGDSYQATIDLPSDGVGDLFYILYVIDTSGNDNQTDLSSVRITDNDAPFLISHSFPEYIGTGEIIEFTILPEDNMGIAAVEGYYTIGDEEQQELRFYEDGPIFMSSIVAPERSLSTIYIFLEITDIYGNVNSSNTLSFSVLVKDTIDPLLSDIEDISVYIGERADINVTCSDNIGIESTTLIGGPDELGEDILSKLETAGLFRIELIVSDAAGNSNSVFFNLTVLPIDNDMDLDGISDLEERDIGTNPLLYDSDNDGMPDGWEYENGLDPLLYSADKDTDGDGISDLQEYNDGTDPNVKEMNPIPWIVGLVLIVIIISVVVGFMVLRFRKKGDLHEDTPPEE